MSTTFRKKQLFEDSAKENGVYPVTVTEAVFNNGGDTLDNILQDLNDLIQNKQDTLVSGTNIKTINNESILGNGNINVQDTLVSGTNIKTINNQSILGSGDLTVSSDTAKALLSNGRISSADFDADGYSRIKFDLATSSMSTGKPAADGYIVSFFWDNAGKWDSQIYVPNSGSQSVQFRQRNGGNWGTWGLPIQKKDIAALLFPVNSIYCTYANTNPNSILGVGTWSLLTSTVITSVTENVFGNGKGLGLYDGSTVYSLGNRDNTNVYKNKGPNVGTNMSTNSIGSSYLSYGVPTKASLGSNTNYSGLIVERSSITVYIWRRTA